MQKAVLIVIVVGTAIGLLLPSGKQEPTVAAASVKQAVKAETRLEREANGHFYVDAEVNDEQLVHFMVDTGASGVALTIEDAERLGVPFSRDNFQVVGTGASGEVRGQFVKLDRISIEGKEARNVNGAVLEGLEISLLGQSYLSRLSGIDISGDTMTLR